MTTERIAEIVLESVREAVARVVSGEPLPEIETDIVSKAAHRIGSELAAEAITENKP